MRNFGFSSTAEEVLKGIDLSGKKVIVTGASGGIGEETARALASKGAEVTIIARNESKLMAAKKRILESTEQEVEIGRMDLESLDSIKTFAQQWLSKHDRLDILINNAGVMTGSIAFTKEGWEKHFAVNHLGSFLLTNLLVPALKASNKARVVNVASAAHHWSTVHFDDIHYKNRDYDSNSAYGQSKTAMIWFSNEFNRRYSSKGICSHSLQPGAILGTDLSRHHSKEEVDEMINYLEQQKVLKTIPQGAATTCLAATAPELENNGGSYLADCRISVEGENMLVDYAPHAFNLESEKKMWEVSNEMLGTNF